jgi:type II secretory pathway component HofQ
VVRIAVAVSEATATFTPADPNSSIDRAASFMVPERADAFKNQFGKATADLAKRNISAQAQTISAGLEALSTSAASVAVIMRGTQSQPGQQPSTAVLALRVGLSKQNGQWQVLAVAPINSR